MMHTNDYHPSRERPTSAPPCCGQPQQPHYNALTGNQGSVVRRYSLGSPSLSGINAENEQTSVLVASVDMQQSTTANTAPEASYHSLCPPANRESSSAENMDREHKVARIINENRQQHGQQALTLQPELTALARCKAQHMATKQYFSHMWLPPHGPIPSRDSFSLLAELPFIYERGTEELATGFLQPERVVRGWLNNNLVREGLLYPAYSQHGIGIAHGSIQDYETIYWVHFTIQISA